MTAAATTAPTRRPARPPPHRRQRRCYVVGRGEDHLDRDAVRSVLGQLELGPTAAAAARRSSSPRASAARKSAGAATCNRSTAARWDSLASVLARRTWASTSPTASSTAGIRRRRPAPPPSAVGHGARWIEPVLPPAPHLVGHEGEDGRQQPLQRVEGAARSAATAEAAGRVAPRAVGAALDQLDVVVAEPPEEGLGALQRPRVVERLEAGGGLFDHAGQAGEHGPVERLGRSAARPPAVRRSASTNLVTLRSLVASLRPICIWPSSKAVSTPGRPAAAQ